MTLPAGWEVAPLDELVDVLDSRRVPVSAKERVGRPGTVPYYGAAGRVGYIDSALFSEDLILLGEDGVQFFDPSKAKAYLISGPAWVNNHAHVLRPRRDRISRRYLCHALNAADYRGFANGTTRLKLTQAAMRRLPIPLPSLEEQRRIVEILEAHLSRLSAAQRQIELALRRLVKHRTASLVRLTHNIVGSRQAILSDIATVALGRQRSPEKHRGDRMVPYLRAANVGWDRLLLDDVKEMHFSEAESLVHRLQSGDILLTEASGSPREVGKSSLYRGEVPGACLQNTVLRIRCTSSTVIPAFLQKYLLADAMVGRFVPASRGVGIAHLGRSRLAGHEIRLPSVKDQRSALAAVDMVLAGNRRLEAEIESAATRAAGLRRSLLQAAFTGQLTGR